MRIRRDGCSRREVFASSRRVTVTPRFNTTADERDDPDRCPPNCIHQRAHGCRSSRERPPHLELGLGVVDVTVSYARGMPPMYSRPTIADQDYVDERGRTVVYGRRRAEAPELGPPNGGTNVFSHQERYEPIFTVAEALIAHLAAAYDVVVDDNVRQSSGFDIITGRPESAFARVVSIRPIASTEAPLLLGFHDQPGSIRVLAGCYSEFDMSFCGCDACDEPWEDVADSLEEVVLSVAESGTTERLDRRRQGSARYWLDPSRRRMWAGSIPKRVMRPEVLAAVSSSSHKLDHGWWMPWTPRTNGA